MTIAPQNFTIVVNWKKKGFGCTRACTYCSWAGSAFLPHGGQSVEAISAFVSQCRKSFVTISGGADPLYKFEEYGDQLLAMVQAIKQHGFKVRIITREVQHIARLKGIIDYVSISLDPDVLEDIQLYQHDWAGMDIDYSLVLPPLPTADIVKLKPQYAALHRRLKRSLVLRENLNSIHPLDLKALSFGHSGIVFVSKALCLSSRYLSTIDCSGHDIVQDNEGLASYLMGNPEVFLFGGFVKHLVNPAIHMEYGDLDVIALDAGVMQVLESRFAFAFREVSPSRTSYPRYFLGKSTRAGKPVQLILMGSKKDALQFVANVQYDADRVAFSAGRFHFDASVGEQAIRHAIDTKQVHPVSGTRDFSLFNANRPMVEQRHKAKLLRKGFTIHE